MAARYICIVGSGSTSCQIAAPIENHWMSFCFSVQTLCSNLENPNLGVLLGEERLIYPL